MLRILLCFTLFVGIVFAQGIPATIVINSNDLIPENFIYYPGIGFISGSANIANGGQVYTIGNDGTVALLAPLPGVTSGYVSLGLAIDGQLLHYCYNVFLPDAAASPQTLIITYNLTDLSSAPSTVDLSLVGFVGLLPKLCNDLVVVNGSIYVTNSVGNGLWKIDPVAGAAQFAQFTPNPPNIEADGIVYIEGTDYLLVGLFSSNQILKVPISDPSSFSQVTITNGEIVAPDGIRYNNGILYVAGNGTLKEVTSSDDWVTASVQRVRNTTYPTPVSVVLINDVPYVINAANFAVNQTYAIELIDFSIPTVTSGSSSSAASNSATGGTTATTSGGDGGTSGASSLFDHSLFSLFL